VQNEEISNVKVGDTYIRTQYVQNEEISNVKVGDIYIYKNAVCAKLRNFKR
jgi:type IV secretory pathway VirB9-like protein